MESEIKELAKTIAGELARAISMELRANKKEESAIPAGTVEPTNPTVPPMSVFIQPIRKQPYKEKSSRVAYASVAFSFPEYGNRSVTIHGFAIHRHEAQSWIAMPADMRKDKWWPRMEFDTLWTQAIKRALLKEAAMVGLIPTGEPVVVEIEEGTASSESTETVPQANGLPGEEDLP